MEIINIEIDGYGKLEHVYLELNKGANLFYGINEAGKSTLKRCILALLFGQKVLDRREELSEKELMRPWNPNAQYRASLTYQIKNGEKYKIIRDFENDNVEIIDLKKRELISDHFPKDSNGEPLLVRTHLGISHSTFISSALIQQDQMFHLEDTRALSGKIMALADTGSQDNTHLKAISRLEKVLTRIGSREDDTTPLGRVLSQMARQDSDYLKIHEQKKSLSRLREEEKQTQEKIQQKEMETEKILCIRKKREIQKLTRLIKQIEEIEAQLPSLEEKFEKGFNPKIINLEGLTRLNTLSSEIEKLEEQKKEIEEKYNQAQEEYQKSKDKTKQYQKYYDIERSSIEVLGLNLESGESRKGLVEGKEKLLEETRQKTLKLQEAYEQEKKKFKNFQDATQYDNHISHLERNVAKKDVIRMKELDLERLEKELKNLKSRSLSRFITSLLVILAGGGVSFIGIGSHKDTFLAGIGVVLLLMGIFFWVSDFKAGKDKSFITESIANRNEEIKKLNDDYASAQIKLKELFTLIGALSVEELRAKYREYMKLKVDLETASNMVKTLERDIKTLKEEFYDTPELRDLLEDLGYLVVSQTPTREVLQRFKDTYQQALQEKEKEMELKRECSVYEEEMDKIQQNIQKARDAVHKLLTRAQMGSVEEFRLAYQFSLEKDKMESFIQSLREKRDLLLSGKTLRELQDKMKNLEETVHCSRIKVEDDELNQYENDEQIQDALEQCREDILQLRSELINTQLRISMIQSLQEGKDNEKEDSSYKKELRKIEIHKEAVELALKTIKEVGKQYHEQYFAPQLSQATGKMLKKITEKYEDVLIDKDLNVSIITPEKNRPVIMDSMSKGTADQIYFIIRLGIVKILSKEDENIPLIMDDPFLKFDEIRRKRAFETLMEIFPQHQVLFFTCSSQQKIEFARLLREKNFLPQLSSIGDLELITPISNGSPTQEENKEMVII